METETHACSRRLHLQQNKKTNQLSKKTKTSITSHVYKIQLSCNSTALPCRHDAMHQSETRRLVTLLPQPIRTDELWKQKHWRSSWKQNSRTHINMRHLDWTETFIANEFHRNMNIIYDIVTWELYDMSQQWVIHMTLYFNKFLIFCVHLFSVLCLNSHVISKGKEFTKVICLSALLLG